MTAEGWDGKSIRQHVAGAVSEAMAARGLAEGAHDEIAVLRAELDGLAEAAHGEIAALRAELGAVAAKVSGGAALPLDGGRE